MLEQDKTAERIARHKETQEDFTPDCVIEQMANKLPDELFTDFSKTFCDPSAGTGNIIVYVFKKRLQYTQTPDEGLYALSTLYGIELIEENVIECKERLRNILVEWHGDMVENIDQYISQINNIVDYNIVCSDFFDWDTDNWCSTKKDPVALF